MLRATEIQREPTLEATTPLGAIPGTSPQRGSTIDPTISSYATAMSGSSPGGSSILPPSSVVTNPLPVVDMVPAGALPIHATKTVSTGSDLGPGGTASSYGETIQSPHRHHSVHHHHAHHGADPAGILAPSVEAMTLEERRAAAEAGAVVTDRTTTVVETTTATTAEGGGGGMMAATAPIPIEGAPAAAGIESHARTLTGAELANRLGRRLIVLAMDDSTASQVALAWTLKQMIHPERDHMVIVTVGSYKTAGLLTTNEEKTAKREIKAESRAQRIVDYAAAHVAEFVRTMGVPLSFELVTLKAADGDVRDVLLDYVRDIGANLLVLGAHSTGAVKRAILGSTSGYCLHHASVPVIIVKEDGGVKAA
ncbi:hypothetical protein H9P43_000360 [Blastocladiella emersonii ATCC 22665]|nr:hypothetical protein H9P43_000360 [Blastocladiella emersonii ATCC 22665]